MGLPPEFSWWNVIPTLVGGAISIATTAILFSANQRVERKKRAIESRKSEALRAFKGFWKLRNVANGLMNLELQIAQSYREADESGMEDALPFSKVKAFVGALEDYELLEIEEVVFLSRQKNIALLNDIELIVRRARTIEVVVIKYNDMKASFEEFIESHAEEIEVLDEPIVGSKLKGRLGVIAHLRECSGNNLLGQLQELLESDCKESKRVTEAYLEAAEKEFGEDFPKFKFVWTDP
jgi:hypothetical protein